MSRFLRFFAISRSARHTISLSNGWVGREYDVLSRKNSPQCASETSDQGMKSISSFQWTSVTSDPALLDHLFQLYFSWVHPVHTLFSEGHFVDSYRRQSNQYCSSILVNSMCAMACHLCTNPEAAEVHFELLGYSFLTPFLPASTWKTGE
jgi:hypothetical protein